MRDAKKLLSMEALGKILRESTWFGAMAVFACLAACLIFWFHPFPGGAIAVLGAAAVVITFRAGIGHKERAWWMIVVFALLFVELRSIRLDREQHDAEQRQALAELRRHFNDIGDGIKNAIRVSDRHFAATMNKSDALITTSTRLVELARQGINATMGGDSFCWFLVSYPDSPVPQLVVAQHGRYPVRDVTARLVDLQKFSRLTANQPLTMDNVFVADVNYTIGDLSPSSGRLLGLLSLNSESGDQRDFNIFFNGLNGSWTELLRFRRVNGKWKQAVRVVKEEIRGNRTSQKLLFEQIDAAYPRKDGKIVWN